MGHPIYKDPEIKPAPKNTLNSFIDEAMAKNIAGKPVAGKASGTAAGNVLNWAYVLRIPYSGSSLDVRVDDWMILVDEGTLLNRADMLFWGLRVGELTIAFRRNYPPRSQNDS